MQQPRFGERSADFLRDVLVETRRGVRQYGLHLFERPWHVRPVRARSGSSPVVRLARITPPHHVAGTIITIPTIQDRRGAWWGSLIIAQTVRATWITPMATACHTGERRANHAVTYPPATTHNAVYTNMNSLTGTL